MTEAVVDWIGGPVLRARARGPLHVNEAVMVGPARLLGEVISLRGDECVAQIYESTTGLRPGDKVVGTGAPMSVRLGPGMLGRIFDGLLRPLDRAGAFLEPGLRGRAADRFELEPGVTVGDRVRGGGVLGTIENAHGPPLCCLVPPDVEGNIERIVAPGKYEETQTIAVLRAPDGELREVSMSQTWPVRRPRPTAARLPVDQPMVTGQRVLDTLFPVARGGRSALPGGFGTGKTILQQALAKFSDADIVVFVGCGERGNEMTEVLEEFPELEDPRTGAPLLDRTVVIANTSNMPVAAREASIYTAVTVAEFFRDQGLNVALMADSTSRWAEALREISGRLGELPAEGGYPAYLSSRLAAFYERAGRVRTLCDAEGSLTIIGAVSPPGGDFSEPVTKHTQRYVRCLWSLDPARAHARSYPAIHPLESYSEDVTVLTTWWESEANPRWSEQRRSLLALLEEQSRLERMARIVGKDALPGRQQLVLECARLANDAFLQQSALSDVDAYCSPARQGAMLRLVVRFVELAEAAIDEGVELKRIMGLEVVPRLLRMREELGEDRLSELEELCTALEHAFASLREEEIDES